MGKVSIKDIAQKAEVSSATVSLVLSGKGKKGRISDEKAKQIRQIAKELNYRPNSLARSLQSGRSQTIGLLVTDISNTFFGSLAFYIQEQIEQSGYTVIIMNTNENDLQMQKMLEILSNRQVDGYIIVPTEHGESSIRQLMEHKLPLVLIDRYFPNLPTCSVTVDGYQASFMATQLLLQKGCKRIAFIMYSGKQSHMEERRNGYSDALMQAGLYNEELVRSVDFLNLKQNMLEVVTLLLDCKVDGILFATNTISLMGLRILFDKGIRIPEQIQLVCFDRNEVFEFMADPIPYVQQPIETMGRKAADLLLEQITSQDKILQTYKFPAKLITGSKLGD